MNTLIRQYAYATCSESTLTGEEVFTFTQAQLDKFAEMIIQGCVDACKGVAAEACLNENNLFLTDALRSVHAGMRGGAIQCERAIQKKFGAGEYK